MGTQAPDFNLPATPDQRLRLSELRGKPVVLVFYPADWSPVCGDELALFNEALPLIKPKQALVLGISVDSAWCHQAFRDARKLHFDLLSDYEPKGEVSRAYGAYDAEGKIAWSYLSPVAINPGVDGVLDALDRL